MAPWPRHHASRKWRQCRRYFSAVNAVRYAGVSVEFNNDSAISKRQRDGHVRPTNKGCDSTSAPDTPPNDITMRSRRNSTVSALFTATPRQRAMAPAWSTCRHHDYGRPPSTGRTSALSANAKIKFTAAQGGPYDGVAINSLINPAVHAGHTVAYRRDEQDPDVSDAAGARPPAT